ncbi:MAG: TM2 domain-containing protein [Pleurocapsa sp.]
MTYRQQNLNTGTAYILWLFCVFGICGIHRLYLGKVASGLLYLFTFGLFGFGQLLDLLLIPGMTRDRNLYLWHRATTQSLSQVHEVISQQQDISSFPKQQYQQNVSSTSAQESPQDPMLELLKVAASHNNVLSLGQAVISLEMPVKTVEKLLQEALKQGLAHIGNDEQTGAVRYYFDI